MCNSITNFGEQACVLSICEHWAQMLAGPGSKQWPQMQASPAEIFKTLLWPRRLCPKNLQKNKNIQVAFANLVLKYKRNCKRNAGLPADSNSIAILILHFTMSHGSLRFFSIGLLPKHQKHCMSKDIITDPFDNIHNMH